MFVPCSPFTLTICSCKGLCTAERVDMNMHVVPGAVLHALFQNVR